MSFYGLEGAQKTAYQLNDMCYNLLKCEKAN